MLDSGSEQSRNPMLPDKDAPGPGGVFVLGSLPEMQRKGQLRFLVDSWRKYGDIVRFQVGPLVQHLFVRPEHVRYVLVENRDNYRKGTAYQKLKLALGQGLFTSEGELWRRQRKLMQPPFTPRGVTQFAPAMTEATERMLERWRPIAARGDLIDVNQEMMRLAMSIIGKTMFNIDVGEEALEAGQAFAYVLEYVGERTVTIFDVPLFVPTSANRRFKKSMGLLDAFMANIIEERRAHKNGHQDLLSILLAAQDEETGQGMSDRQLRDEVLTIFFAGHETTAQALTWVWYSLSQHPEVETKLQSELERVLAGRTPTEADLTDLPYTRMVIDETMRLYPPVWAFARDAIGDDEIGGYRIPAGSMVLLSQYVTHRHPEFWDNPDAFDPERFLPERSEGRPQYAYFPFGGGPRTCIGNSFALLEAQLALATIAQRYRLELATGHPVEARAVGTLRPAEPVMMRLVPRRG